MSFQAEVSVVREMVSTLETLTIAGQRHTMSKLVAFIRDRLAAGLPDAPRSRSVFADQLATLNRESERPLPNVDTFHVRVDSLLALVSAER